MTASGWSSYQEISQEPLDGLIGIDAVLARGEYGATVEEVFADWVVANFVWNPDATPEGIYGYRVLPAG
ncbi:MAG UNVERIFIED_CONTAM: hypothetical protein LVT10_02670 [Anaerolineae bacterium]|jgi:hypothetical protein